MKLTFKEILKRIDWVNSAFLILTPLIACAGVFYLYQHDMIHGATVALAVFMAIATGLGITAGYHRLFSHRAYDANPLFKIILLAFGAAAFQNSARKWSSDHRNHHKFVDTDKDPYNIQKGFLWAHIGWIMFYYGPDHEYNNVADLEMDKWVLWQEKHYVSLGILVSFVLPTLIATLWGDPLGGLLIAGFLRAVLNHHFTFSINSFCHMIGNRPYSDRDSSRDNWFLALVTYGEGYHNYHHKFPADYRNGIRSYQWDPTKWLIAICARIGWTTNLRRTPAEKILQARLKMDEKRVFQKIERQRANPLPVPREFVASARLKFEEAYIRFRAHKVEYYRLKNEKAAHLHERIEKLKLDLMNAKGALKDATVQWKIVCQRFGVKSTRFRYVPVFE